MQIGCRLFLFLTNRIDSAEAKAKAGAMQPHPNEGRPSRRNP